MRRLLVVKGDEGGVEEDDAEDEGLEVGVLHLGWREGWGEGSGYCWDWGEG